MIKGLLKKLGLGKGEAALIDAVVERAADAATGGAAGKVEDAVEAVVGEVKRRKKK
ncbi:MAG: hypothetical protein LW689_04395 [Novosphingobium sp.]|jgi:hypothetical protein|nr:hypothetical protein [Novosphingobium sp.]MCE2842024.1 hypothetical protein [Novosphingobium sp.]